MRALPLQFLQSMHLPRPALRVFFELLVLVLVLGGPGAAQGQPPDASVPAAPRPKRVVILLGTGPSLPALRLFDDAFRKALIAQTPGGVTFFTDTLDAQRFSYASIAPEFLALQHKKYAAQRIDLVVGIADAAVDFVRDLTARVAERAASRSRWQREVWDRDGIDELRLRVATLDRSSAVLFTSILRDEGGRAGFAADAMARIAETSKAPVYGLFGTLMGSGAVAGQVVDLPDLGRRAAQMAASLLAADGAKAPATVKVATPIWDRTGSGLKSKALPGMTEGRR